MADHFGNRYFPGRYFPAGYFQGGEENPGAMSASLSGSAELVADLDALVVTADNSAGAGYSGVSDGRILRLKQVQDEELQERAERKRRAILASNAAIMSAVIASIVTFEGLNG